MPRGYWNKRLPDRSGLAAAVFASALLIVLGIWPAFLEQRELGREAANQSAYYSSHAKNEVSVKCAGLSGQARSDCAYETNQSARKDQREEYDLYSQRSMAIWTGVMGWMAVVGVSLSLVGVYLIWQTWVEARETVEVTRKIGEAQVRSYLSIAECYVTPEKSGSNVFLKIEVTIINSGQSPAHNVGISLANWDGQMLITADMAAGERRTEPIPFVARDE